jgi:PAS domain S-box-containing protein
MGMNHSRIVDALPELVLTLHSGGASAFVNRRWSEYTGQALADALEFGWQTAIHPDDVADFQRSWEDISRFDAPGEIDVRLRRFDGEYRWYSFRFNHMLEGAAPWCASATHSDERGVDRRLRRFVDNLPTQVLFMTPALELEFVNRQVRNFYRATPEELPQWATSGVIHPDDVPEISDKLLRLHTHGEPFHTELRVLTAEGVYRYVRAIMVPSKDAHGNIVRYCSIQTDIDDLKRAYAQLTEGQRLSKTGSFTWDVLADEHNWSEEIRRIFGFDSDLKVSMPAIVAAVHPQDMAEVERVIGGAVEGRDFDLVFRILTTTGEVRYAHVVGHRMAHVTDRLVFAGALQDVTENKFAVEALDRARRELADVSRATALSALTASIAHEVNQPLAGIITNCNTVVRLLAADPPNLDGVLATAQRAVRDAYRAVEVIKRLRALFARKPVGNETVDLNEAAREILMLSSGELQSGRVVLHTSFADDLPEVAGDRVQLQQVVLNFVINAAHAMRTVDDRTRTLWVSTARGDEGDVVLAVRDCGIGAAVEDFEKMFNAFYTTKPDGMGVGLSISRSILEAHGGRLWASANDGPGLTVSFSIPVASASDGS